jgi:hypothetical protein
MPRPEARRHQQLERHALQLGSGIAEQALGGVVAEDDALLGIDDDRAVVEQTEDRGKAADRIAGRACVQGLGG